MKPANADRQPLVEQLVGHHVPVDDLARDDCQTRGEREPEPGEPELVAASHGKESSASLPTALRHYRRTFQRNLAPKPSVRAAERPRLGRRDVLVDPEEVV